MANDWRRFFPRFRREARQTIQNREKLGEMLSNASGKAAQHKTSLQAVWNDLQTMLRLMRAWIAGDYRQVSATTVVAIVGALAYLLSPLDAVLDVIPVLGLVDDAAVIGVVVSQVRDELNAFRAWEYEHLPRLEAADDTTALKSAN